jgi:hypothetical protein
LRKSIALKGRSYKSNIPRLAASRLFKFKLGFSLE